jgi:cystathionine beta-lyase/cystathionine gamma-synthase
MKDETLVTHQPLAPLKPGNVPLTGPIYQSVKFEAAFESLLHDRDGLYFYSRVANPTVRQLELLMAKLQGREEAVAVGSGVATLSVTLLSLLSAGDHVILFLESYKPTRYLVRELLGKYGVTHTLASVTEGDQWERHILPGKTKLVLLESPTNPMTRVVNLSRTCETAKRHHVLTVLDNTFAGVHQHREFPVDLYLHSLTKFSGGHGDVMGGVIIGDKARIQQIHMDAAEMGPTLDPHAAYLILRGMKTYFLRFREHGKNALALAQWLETQKDVEKVWYPGLPSHPDHEIAKHQMKDFGGVLAFDLKGGSARMTKFLSALKIFKLAGSLGSTESLAAPVLAFYATDLTEDERKIACINDRTVRLSVGIEDSSDLIEDLASALRMSH